METEFAEVRAPAVVKLLGEHAVVYGKMSLAVAISLYARANVSAADLGILAVELKDFGKKFEFGEEEIKEIYDAYRNKDSIDSYVDGHSGKYAESLPYLTIAARLYAEYGIKPLGSKVSIESNIPIRSGLASSAACSAAFALALLKHSDARPSDAEIIDIARDGDRVIHRNGGAGKIDASTSFYGGFVSYSSESGVSKEKLDASIELLLIDTGPKKSTAETVGHVADLYRSDRSGTERILDMVDACSRRGITALKNNDIAEFGRCMFDDHSLLMGLGVSSAGLDKVVEYAKNAGAYGAKLSGGGGGGLAIAIDNTSHSLESLLVSNGFKVARANISDFGASSYLPAAGKRV